MNEFIILFRSSEAALIVGIIYLFLTNNAPTQKLWLAVLSAIFASIVVAYFTHPEALGNTSSNSFEGIFMFITAIFIWYVIFWLSKHVSDKQLEEEEQPLQ